MSADQKEVAALRKWLRTHDPEFERKRKDYNESQIVKDRRRKVSRRRRLTSCALMHLVKNSKSCCIDGKNYQIKGGRLTTQDNEGNYVVRVDRKGNVYKLELDSDSELDDDKYDMSLEEKEKTNLIEQVERLFEGDEELEKAVARKSVKVIEEIPSNELYWKDPEQKKKLLESLQKRAKK